MRNVLSSRTDTAFRAGTVAALALAACSLAWNQFGSTLARDWLPYAIATALLVAGLLLSGRAERPTRLAVAGLVGLIGLAGWDALSLLWSPVPELARDEALLVGFYALAFTVPLLVLRSEAERRVATGLVIALLVVLTLWTFVYLLITGRPTDYMDQGRLTFPVSYANAQAALFLVSFWPCVALAARRAFHPLLRGAAIAGATALLAGGLMTQSKGGFIALAVSGIVFSALSPERLRAVLPTLIPAALVGGAYELLTRPFRERFGADFAGAIRAASWTAFALVGLAFAVGLAYALGDRRISVPPRIRRGFGVSLAGAVAVVVVALPIAFFATADRPGHVLEQKWHSFKTIPARERGSSHLTSLGSNRYDFWRVDLSLARDHPLIGVGARGFATEYLATRRSDETPARGHSQIFDQLAETGLIGLGLLAAAIGFPLAGALARARARDNAIVGAGVAAGAVYVIVHAAGDWVWTFPAVGLPLFLLLGIANAGAADGHPSLLVRGRAAVIFATGALALAFGAFCLPWLSARLTQAALRNPASAAGDLRWAGRLDPLAVEPLLAEATLATQPGDVVAALRRAVAKQPEVPSLHYRLGLAELAAGNRQAARADLSTAHRLDPRSDIVAKALQRASH